MEAYEDVTVKNGPLVQGGGFATSSRRRRSGFLERDGGFGSWSKEESKDIRRPPALPKQRCEADGQLRVRKR